MDFGWTAEQQTRYDRALEFARTRLGKAAGEGDAFPRDRWRALGEFGFLGLSAPVQHGGLGLGALETAHLAEALGRGCEDTGLVFSAFAHLFACVMPIAEHGSEALRAELLPRLCSGEWVGANAITEPEAGSDVHALKTRAVVGPDGGYELTGQKSYVTNGPEADVLLTYAVTNPKHGFMGLSAFAVLRGDAGVTLGKAFKKLGLETSPIAPVFYDAVRVPAARLVGAPGAGAKIFKSSMHWERACLFAAYVGVMERGLELTVKYARERRQFDRAIGKNQAISHRLADMKLRLEAARMLLYRACWMADQGQDASQAIAIAKVAISEWAVQSGLDCIQIHGGLGVISESGIDRLLRDAVPSTLFSGTSEIQRDLIARGLGL